MKKITLSIILTCIIAVISTAQSSKELLANRAKDKFEGKWVGVANGDSVVIYLLQTTHRIEKSAPIANDTTVYLYGWHEIRNNGKVIESSLCNASYSLDREFTIMTDYTSSKKHIRLAIKDVTRDKILDATLTPLGSDEAILTAEFKARHICFRINGSPRELPGQTMPKEIKLTRVSNDMQYLRADMVLRNPYP